MKTLAEVKAKLTYHGETAAAWARRHGVSESMTRNVLSGRVKGRSGEAHKIAVSLGIKEGVIHKGEEL